MEAIGPFRLSDLSTRQQDQLRTYAGLLRTFNQKINLISRENEAYIWERHVLHCLNLAAKPFPDGADVADWGTGGGLPAIPLAICFPGVTFHAVDSVGKKIQAVQAMARRLGLTNLHAWNTRAEQWTGQAHYSVSRATAPLLDLWSWHVRVRQPLPFDPPAGAWQPGLICLKGGDLTEEIASLRSAHPDAEVVTTQLYFDKEKQTMQEKLIVEVRDGRSTKLRKS
jgi:16S rRNA (guanine527-N7)-methyltransferase